MASPAPTTTRVARAAARRALLGAVLRTAGVGLAAGCAVGLAAIGVDRLAGGIAGPWWLLGVPAAIGGVAGIIVGVRRAWTLVRAATEIDHALGLRDALSSALELASGATADDRAFIELATQDAERLAATVRVRDVVRIRPGASWLAWPLLGAGAVAMALFVPRLQWSEPSPAAAEPIAERTELAGRVADATREAREALEAADADAATTDQLEALEQLERELAQGDARPDEIASKAATALDDVAKDLDREADLAAREAEALRRQLAETSPASDGPTSELADALSRGDVAGARDAAQRLLEQAPTLDDEQRRRLARDLESMADALEREQPPTEAAPSQGSNLEEELTRQGVDEQTREQLEREMDPAEAQRRLEEQGVDPDVARRLGERTADEARRNEAERRADEQRDALNDAMRRTAEDLDPDRPNPEQPEQPNQDQQQQPNPDNQPGADQPRPEQSPDARPGDQERPGEQGQAEPREGEGAQPQEQDRPGQPTGEPRPSGQPSDQREGQPREGQQAEPREGADQQQGQQGEGEPTQDPGAKPMTDPAKEGQRKGQQQGERGGEQPGAPTTQPGEQGQQPGEQPQSQPGRPGETPGVQPGQGEQPGQSASPEPGAEGAPGAEPQQDQTYAPGFGERPGGDARPADLYEQLRRMADRERDGERSAEDARRLRERAQELMESATPEQREQMQRLAEQMREQLARETPPPLEDRQTDLFDARSTAEAPEPAPEQVLAQWYADQPVDAPGATGAARPSERMREAAAGAERAIEQQQVPRRHRDLLRRVFKRYAGEAPAPARVEDGADAGGS